MRGSWAARVYWRRGTWLSASLMWVWVLGAMPCEGALAVGVYGGDWTKWTLRDGSKAFNFVIHTVRVADPDPGLVDTLRQAQAAGLQIILEAKFYESKTQRAGRPGSKPLREVAYYESLISRVLDSLVGVKIEAVSLEEENVFWSGRAEFLSTLYRSLKRRYPDIRFYQWYAWSTRVNIPGETWPILPADGWIIDPYGLSGDDYQRYLRGMLRLGKPVISVVWSSPNWRVRDRQRRPDGQWWNLEGWKTFHSQISANIRHGVPTALFMYWLGGAADESILPLWTVEDSCGRRFLERVLEVMVPTVRSGPRGAVDMPSMRPDWIPGFCEQ